MADSNFFNNTGPYTLEEIAKVAKASSFVVNNDTEKFIDVAPLNKASKDEISFISNSKYIGDFEATKAGLCVVKENWVEFAPKDTSLLLCNDPHFSYALIAQHFYQDIPKTDTVIDPNASVHPSAKVGKGTFVKAGAVLAENVVIGDNSVIGSGAVLEKNVQVGSNTIIESNVVVSHSLIGNNVTIYAGAKIGQRGFGFAMSKHGFAKVPQLGRVIIEDYAEIGANTTIDRGAGPDTIIGQGTMIDNLVQIGHNVQIGKYCVIVSQVGISGSTKLGDNVIIAGQAGLVGHLDIGSGTRIGAQCGIKKNLEPGSIISGSPSFPAKEHVVLKKMANSKKLRDLMR